MKPDTNDPGLPCSDCRKPMTSELWWDDVEEDDDGEIIIGTVWCCPDKCPNGVEYW